MTAWDNFLTLFILLAIFLTFFIKVTGKGIGEVITEIREALSDKSEGG